MKNLQNDLNKCALLLTLLDSTFRGATFNGIQIDDLLKSLRSVMNATQAHMHQHVQPNTTDDQARAEFSRAGACLTEARCPWVGLTEDELQGVVNALPGGAAGFLKTWGWLQLSRAVEALCKEKNSPHA